MPGSHHTGKRYIVSTAGTVGDMLPFLSIARSLCDRGNKVTFIGPHIHQHYANKAGIENLSLGTSEQYLSIINNPDIWHPLKGTQVVLQAANEGIRPFVEAVKAFPDDGQLVILAHPLVLPAAAIVKSARPGTRIIGAYLAPANLRTVHDPLTIGPHGIPPWMPKKVRQWIWRIVDARIINPAGLPGLNAARATYGLAPVSSFIEHMYGVADRSLALFPSWFAHPQPDWPEGMVMGDFQLYDPTPQNQISSTLENFLASGDAPIVFTPGTGNLHTKQYFEFALEISRRLALRAIFLTPFQDQVPSSLPASVLWQSYLPFRTLLPRVRALVHHGGIGTTAEALRAGIPQLVVPLSHDQFDNGRRVQALGVGDVLITSRLRFNAFFNSLNMLLSVQEMALQAKIIAQRLGESVDNDALCETIENT